MRSPAAGSGDGRTSLRRERVSKHRLIPNDLGPRWPDQTKRTLTSLLCPLKNQGGLAARAMRQRTLRPWREAEGGYRVADPFGRMRL